MSRRERNSRKKDPENYVFVWGSSRGVEKERSRANEIEEMINHAGPEVSSKLHWSDIFNFCKDKIDTINPVNNEIY